MTFVGVAGRINTAAVARLGEDCEVLTESENFPLRGVFYTPFEDSSLIFGVTEEPNYKLVVEESSLVAAPLTLRGKVRILGKTYTVVDKRSEEYGLVTFILRPML